MRRITPTLVALIAVTCLPAVVSALVTTRFDPPDQPTPADPSWPEGLVEVVNFKGQVLCVATDGFGYTFNHFYYRGNTAALNRFLQKYGEVKAEQLLLIIHAGAPRRIPAYAEKLRGKYDWGLGISKRLRLQEGDGQSREEQKPRFAAEVWLSKDVSLDEMLVPLNVEVKSGGEIDRFIKMHREKQAHRTDTHGN